MPKESDARFGARGLRWPFGAGESSSEEMGSRRACRLAGARTVHSVPELQKAQKLEQVDRIGDETIGLLVAKALKARRGSFGAVLARCRTVLGNAMSEGARGKRAHGEKSTWRSIDPDEGSDRRGG